MVKATRWRARLRAIRSTRRARELQPWVPQPLFLVPRCRLPTPLRTKREALIVGREVRVYDSPKLIVGREVRVYDSPKLIVNEMKWNDEMMNEMMTFWVFDPDETFICYRGCLNLNCYMGKKVHENFLMGLKVWWSWQSRFFFFQNPHR